MRGQSQHYLGVGRAQPVGLFTNVLALGAPVPSDQQHCRVLPVKEGNARYLRNYRPITITGTERCVRACAERMA